MMTGAMVQIVLTVAVLVTAAAGNERLGIVLAVLPKDINAVALGKEHNNKGNIIILLTSRNYIPRM